MTGLPTGTVTFLFTDIEGSTNLARTLGERWPEVLEQHHDILRKAIRDHGGVDVRTEGDAFFAVFVSAADAVAAAAAAQRELSEHPWPGDGPVRVRMGMHTGEGRLGGDEYVGLDVHRAARIAAAGHGGQVLISEATRGLAAERLPGGVSIRDLGHHRLKDFDEPKPIHQVVIDGLPGEFPPLKTLEVPTNLPMRLTSFVGRERELAEVEALLSAHRLLTLIGPGGTGKTRLALEVASRRADRHPDGVFFVDLSPIRDPALVPSTVIQALGLKERADRPALDTATAYLADRHVLMLMDNFEQVVDAAPVVEELLRASSGVKVLATSRIRLAVMGEQEFPVPPLGVPQDPGDLEALRSNDAVALFGDRARAANPSFELTEQNAEAIAEICARLDGLPLAIELAAAQLRLLAPVELLARLEHRLPLRTGAGNVPERQRTLRATIEWSYHLLDEPERRLFARLSVFAGGATLDAIEAVGNPDGDLGQDTLAPLGSLIDHSLVRRHDSPEGSRFAMLETIREYAAERLAAEFDLEQNERRHAEFFTRFIEEWGPAVRSPRSPEATGTLVRELDNVRAAIDWALRGGHAGAGLRIAAPMWMFWVERGHIAEGRKAIESLLDLPAGDDVGPARAEALLGLGALLYWQADYPGASSVYRAALDEFRRIGDIPGAQRAANDLAYSLLAEEKPEGALPLIEEALEVARASGDRLLEAEAYGLMGIARSQRDDLEGALEAFTYSMERFEATGPGAFIATVWVGEAKGRIGSILRRMGRLDEAENIVVESLIAGRWLAGNLGAAATSRQLGAVAWDRGDRERAVRLFAFSEVTAERIGGPPPAALIQVMDPADFREMARKEMGDETVERLWAEGRAMSLDEGIGYMVAKQS